MSRSSLHNGSFGEKFRLAVEPGGAFAFAALLSGVYQPSKNERIVVILCGANADLAKLELATRETTVGAVEEH